VYQLQYRHYTHTNTYTHSHTNSQHPFHIHISNHNNTLQIPQPINLNPQTYQLTTKFTRYVNPAYTLYLLSHNTSCVMLCISNYKHTILTPPIRLINNQLHIQMLCCLNHTINTLMSLLPHDQLPNNNFTNIMIYISQYNHPYVIPPTRSVTKQFHYKCYAIHHTIKISLCHLSHTISYHSIPLTILCCPSHTINTPMSPLPHDLLPINSITNIMLSISHYKYSYDNPPTRSVTNQYLYKYYDIYFTI
jgi:hypothetical protein